MLDTVVVAIDTDTRADLVADLRYAGQNDWADRVLELTACADVDVTAETDR